MKEVILQPKPLKAVTSDGLPAGIRVRGGVGANDTMVAMARAQALALWQSESPTAANMRKIIASGDGVIVIATTDMRDSYAGIQYALDADPYTRRGGTYPNDSYIEYNPMRGFDVYKGDTVYILNDGTSVLAHEFSHATDTATRDYYARLEIPARAQENEIRELQGIMPIP